MISIRLSSEIESRLENLAKRIGHTKTFYAREAILEHQDDLVDTYLAEQRLLKPARTFSAEEVKRDLGLAV